MFSSDISHLTYPSLRCLPDAYGLLADGLLSPEDFRRFTFDHAVELYTRTNPQFFEGTTVEAAASSSCRA